MWHTKKAGKGVICCIYLTVLAFSLKLLFQICAGLTHPYNYRLFPKDVEICIITRSHQNVSKFPIKFS